MKIKNTLLLLVMMCFFGCSAEQGTHIQERLASSNPAEVKSALADIWRLNKSENTTDALDALKNNDTYAHAALALSLFDSESIDELVLSRLETASRLSNYLYYFALCAKRRGLNPKVVTVIEKKYAGFNNEQKVLCAVALAAKKPQLLEDAAKIMETSPGEIGWDAKREAILAFGSAKLKKAYPALQAIKEKERGLKPFINWAMNSIKNPQAVKYDFKDRVIAQNPLWQKHGDRPVVPVMQGTYKSVHTANPDILKNGDTVYFYYRGGDGHDRMCLATVPYAAFNGVNFTDYNGNPIIDIGKDAFDDAAVLDPATVFFKNKVFLYYSGLGTGDDAVGLAVSKDFRYFEKYKNNPVFTGRAPEAVLKDGVIYMYYVKPNEKLGYSIYLKTSTDGYKFYDFGYKPVFTFGAEGQWDSKSVTTPRIVEKEGVYYMVYCGDDKYMDYPPFFGLAFSYDLVNWYRSSQNPVFSRGAKGTWDDGGIWYGEAFPYKDKWYLYYEGWGGGESHEKEYGPGGRSQIGLAISLVPIEEML